MKIVCQSCGKNYKIADEKVQGKKAFKIKCKNCGADILVRGLDAEQVEAPPEDEATRAMSTEAAMGLSGMPEADAEPIWHAVVQGEQQGPYSVPQVQEMLATGAIDAETYVWRDGFDGWLPLREVAELAVVLEGGGNVAMLSGAMPMSDPEPPPGDDLFGGSTVAQPSPLLAAEPARAGGDLFGAEPSRPSVAQSSAEAARTRAPKSAAGDLFAAEARAEEAAKPLFVEEPKAPTGEHLTGQRNENSVLFSLATLQQLSGNEEPKAPVGAASGDSSGLIDINKLAGAISSNRGPGKSSGVDDILSVGTTGGLNSPLAAPVLAPVALPAAAPVVPAAPVEPARPQAGSKTTMMTAIAVASILGITGIAAAFILKGRDEGNTNVAANTAPAAAATAAPGGGTAPARGGADGPGSTRSRPQPRPRQRPRLPQRPSLPQRPARTVQPRGPGSTGSVRRRAAPPRLPRPRPPPLRRRVRPRGRGPGSTGPAASGRRVEHRRPHERRGRRRWRRRARGSAVGRRWRWWRWRRRLGGHHRAQPRSRAERAARRGPRGARVRHGFGRCRDGDPGVQPAGSGQHGQRGRPARGYARRQLRRPRRARGPDSGLQQPSDAVGYLPLSPPVSARARAARYTSTVRRTASCRATPTSRSRGGTCTNTLYADHGRPADSAA